MIVDPSRCRPRPVARALETGPRFGRLPVIVWGARKKRNKHRETASTP